MVSIASTDAGSDFVIDERRLSYARIDGPAVVQAHIAENKNYVRFHLMFTLSRRTNFIFDRKNLLKQSSDRCSSS